MEVNEFAFFKASENRLALNIGLMSLIPPFFGGMPVRHGGVLAAKYYFGARTGGSSIIEGPLEILAGLFFASSIVMLRSVYPLSLIGSMLLLMGFELVAFIMESRFDRDLVPLAATVLISLAATWPNGFAAGLIIHYALEKISRMDKIMGN